MDPLTVIGGGLLLAALVRRRTAPDVSIASGLPKPVVPKCDPKALEKAALTGGVSGAQTGGAAGPWGAGIGAVAGVALNVAGSGACTSAQFNAAKKKVCANADKVLGKIGGKPPGWGGWSCDQRLAYAASLGPVLTGAIAVGNLAKGSLENARDELKRFGSRAGKAAGNVGESVKEAGQKVGDFFDGIF